MTTASPIDRRSLAQLVADHVRGEILRGELAPGQRIAEEAIAERLGVSRTPIREALRQLAQQGLVHIQPRSWAAVSELDQDQLAEVRELRCLIESNALAHCDLAADATLLEDLDNLQAEMEAALARGDLAAVFEADGCWHQRLLAGRPIAAELNGRLEAKIQLARASRCSDPTIVRKDISAHRRIRQALARGDHEQAVGHLRRHILESGSL